MSDDQTQKILELVSTAISDNKTLSIHASGSHDSIQPDFRESIQLDLQTHSGILDYQPTELNIKARAGTTISEIKQTLSQHQQRLPTDFIAHSPSATLGGAIAVGQSGSSRPFQGAIRDHILGASLIDGRAELLHCGGQVMKNVAGYDVSRLLTGSLGTLGPILDLTIKVLPVAEQFITLSLEQSEDQAIQLMNRLAGRPLPIAASLYYENTLYIRLEGIASGVQNAREVIGGESIQNPQVFWDSIQQQQHLFFQSTTPLWRVVTPTSQPAFKLQNQEDMMIDWCGGLRWISARQITAQDIQFIQDIGGSIQPFRYVPGDLNWKPYRQISALSQDMQRKVKKAFDPQHLFNPRLSMFFFDAQ